MFLYRMSHSAVLFTVRSSSVFQDVGSANSMVICMFPRYILDWLSNLKPLNRTGKACNGTCGRKSICFIVKILCAETICINWRLFLWLVHTVLHALWPLAGPGGAAPVLVRHAVHHQSTSVCMRQIHRLLKNLPGFIDLINSAFSLQIITYLVTLLYKWSFCI